MLMVAPATGTFSPRAPARPAMTMGSVCGVMSVVVGALSVRNSQMAVKDSALVATS